MYNFDEKYGIHFQKYIEMVEFKSLNRMISHREIDLNQIYFY